jgi:pSer/pThr/pTyr-binding forkhead associated (FHA) protein
VSDAAGARSAFLVTVIGPSPGQRFPLDERATIIGRGPEVAIYLKSSVVSRQHARIVNEGNVYYVEDLGSMNGTFVNGKRIAGRVILGERDRLEIGPYEMALQVDPASNPTESAPMNRQRQVSEGDKGRDQVVGEGEGDGPGRTSLPGAGSCGPLRRLRQNPRPESAPFVPSLPGPAATICRRQRR